LYQKEQSQNTANPCSTTKHGVSHFIFARCFSVAENGSLRLVHNHQGGDNIKGYINLYRTLLDWEWWNDHNTTRLWTYILLRASFRPSTWHGIDIQPGQLITSRAVMSKETGLTENEIRTSLSHLQTTGEITIKTTNRYSLVTIANWAKFQKYIQEITSETTSDLSQKPPHLNNNKNIYTPSKQPDGSSGKKKIFEKDSMAYKAAIYLDKQICTHLPKKPPSDEQRLQSWASHFDRLNRIDEQSWVDIGNGQPFLT
jgi:hypothetical protein